MPAGARHDSLVGHERDARAGGAVAEQEGPHAGLLGGQEARVLEQASEIPLDLGAGVASGDQHPLAGLLLEDPARVVGVQ
ncbi:hypothetical protein D3C87_1773980 [compost metagenome]